MHAIFGRLAEWKEKGEETQCADAWTRYQAVVTKALPSVQSGQADLFIFDLLDKGRAEEQGSDRALLWSALPKAFKDRVTAITAYKEYLTNR